MCHVDTYYSIFISLATPCRTPINLLDNEIFDYQLVIDERITASSFDPLHPPSQARLSGSGWCFANACNTQPGNEYLQIDFGAELVVEAITVANISGGHVKQYKLEYAEANSIYEYVNSEATNSIVSAKCPLRSFYTTFKSIT